MPALSQSHCFAIAWAIAAADGNSSATERGRRFVAIAEGLVRTPSAYRSKSGTEGACGTWRGTTETITVAGSGMEDHPEQGGEKRVRDVNVMLARLVISVATLRWEVLL